MSTKNSIVGAISSAFAKTKFAINKNSPEIMLATGIVAGVGCVILTAIASYKATQVVSDAKETIADISEDYGRQLELADTDEEAVELQEIKNQDIAKVYVHAGLALARLYALAALAGAVSIGSILVSHRILTKRSAAISAALLAVTEGFNEYRDRVRSRFGEEVEKEIRYNIHEEEVDGVEKDPITGEEKLVKKKVKVSDMQNGHSIYAKFFDETNRNWEKDSEYNRIWLSGMQSRANDLLVANGHLFLNDVYDMLDFPKTQAGQVVGWLYRPNDPTHSGANYVDFGMFDAASESKRDFINGYERSIILDFNVDGEILSKSPFESCNRR